jgi:hypothetical protein
MSVHQVLLVVALVLFVVAALVGYVGNPPRVNLVAAGLAFLAAGLLVP